MTRGSGSEFSARRSRSWARRCSSAFISSSTSRSAACVGAGKICSGLSPASWRSTRSPTSCCACGRIADPDRPRANPIPEYRVALVTKSGDLRLSDRMYADAKQPSEVADAIRAALGRPPGRRAGRGEHRAARRGRRPDRRHQARPTAPGPQPHRSEAARGPAARLSPCDAGVAGVRESPVSRRQT